MLRDRAEKLAFDNRIWYKNTIKYSSFFLLFSSFFGSGVQVVISSKKQITQGKQFL